MNNLEFYNATLKDTCNTTYAASANELLWSKGQTKVQIIYQRQVQAIRDNRVRFVHKYAQQCVSTIVSKGKMNQNFCLKTQ